MSRRRSGAGWSTLALATAGVVAVSATATAQGADPRVRFDEPPPRPSLNLYGATGLIDLPSAESQPDGQLSASFAMFGNTTRRNLTFQILPRLSGTLRYATIDDWSQQGDLFDRSFDIQFQILQDRGRWQPSLAVGLRDFLGTGVYSSEYIVATKRITPDIKVTGGIGWGRLAGEGHFDNPFCQLSDDACDRETDIGEGGNLESERFFRGEEVALFGGVEWLTPIDGLTLKAEYSPDEYEPERRSSASDFERNSPFNFGAEYRWGERTTLGVYYMYGSAVGFNLAFSGNPSQPSAPQDLGAGPVPVTARPANANYSGAWVNDPENRARLAEAISEVLRADGITVERIGFAPDEVDVQIINRRISDAPKAIGRTARVLAVGMPPSVQRFRITPVENGLPTTTAIIDRGSLEAQVDRPNAGLESWQTTELVGASPGVAGAAWTRDVYPDFDWAIAPEVEINIFAGDEGFRPQLNLELRGSLEVARGLSFSGEVNQPVLGTFDDPGPAEGERTLPPVRRESGRYYAGSDPKLMRLTGDYIFKLNRQTYGRVSAGYLERQFAGASAEVLWKPVDQSWGLGFELNHVRQRSFQSFLGFRDYEVTTGHASLYWDTGFEGFEVQVDAGRYLAKDWGATLTVSRRFPNGWVLGAFATRTDVSAEDFGEGSFDKGVVLSIPLRWATPFETRQRIQGTLRSLSSDGGARLNVQDRLYPIIRDFDEGRLERNWGSFWQ
jgi:hypothetical protein